MDLFPNKCVRQFESYMHDLSYFCFTNSDIFGVDIINPK